MHFPKRGIRLFTFPNIGFGTFIVFMTIALMSMSGSVIAQEESKIQKEGKSEKEEHQMKGTHRFTFELAHTHVSKGKDIDGDRKWLTLPSLSLNYDYWLANKWAIGVHSDLITETFIIEKHDGEELERSNPLAVAAVGLFKSGRHSTFIIGAGMEFAKEENLFLNRIGYEWGAAFNHRWEVGGAIAYDIRWNAYDSFTIGFGVSYMVGINKHKKEHKVE